MADPAYLKLQAEWDRKLRESGFKDAEDRNTGLLKRWTGSGPLFADERDRADRAAIKQTHPHEASARSKYDAAAYFRMAGAFLYEYPFTSEDDRAVWELHADGVSLKKSADHLRMSVKWVRRRVSRLRLVMLSGTGLSGAQAVTSRK